MYSQFNFSVVFLFIFFSLLSKYVYHGLFNKYNFSNSASYESPNLTLCSNILTLTDKWLYGSRICFPHFFSILSSLVLGKNKLICGWKIHSCFSPPGYNLQKLPRAEEMKIMNFLDATGKGNSVDRLEV